MTSVLRSTGLPFWALQLLTGAKSFETNPLIGSRLLNRWGLHERRVRLAARLAGENRRKLAARIAPEDRAAFDRDGFVVRRDFLPPDLFRTLLAQVRGFQGPFREKAEGRTILRKVTVDRAVETAIPALRDVRSHPEWQALIRYAGSRDAEPEMFLQAVLQLAADGPDDPQTALHADTFHPTVKAWLFLTDVEEDAGAFTFVPGSHRLTPERLAWETRISRTARDSTDPETRQGSFRIEEAELAALGLPPPRALGVPANTLVVADTFGFHARGRSLRPSVRVEVWGIGHRAPFLPWPSLDPAVAALGSVGRPANRWDIRHGLSLFDDGRAGGGTRPA